MNAALTWARLSYRQQRWELILVAIGVAVAAGAQLWFASQVEAATAAAAPCLSAMEVGTVQSSCLAILNQFQGLTGFADNVLLLSFGASFGIGVLLGAPLVAREIDGGTAQLAWSIGRSRTWWLLRRIAFIALFVVIGLGILAVTSELLASALAPDRNLGSNFIWFGRRGWLIVARGIGALMLGMLVGTLIGRVLPAILASALVIAIAFTGLSIAQDRWQESLVQTRDSSAGASVSDDGALVIGSGLRLPDGEVVTWAELGERGMDATYIDEQGRMYASEQDMRDGNVLGTEVTFSIPGSRYGEVVAVVGAGSLGLGLAALALTVIVVRRRRPV